MSRRRTAPQSTYEKSRRAYLLKKRRAGKPLTPSEESFLSANRAPTASSTVGNEPEPLSVPLEGLLGVGAEEEASAAPPTAETPTDPYPPPGDGERERSAGPSVDESRAIAKVFVGYLKNCNNELKTFSTAFVLPEEAFTYLITPCAEAVCERHAGKIEIGEREQTLVVIGSALATFGQLIYLKRKQAAVSEPSIPVQQDQTAAEMEVEAEAISDMIKKRPTLVPNPDNNKRNKVTDLIPSNAFGVVKPS